MIEKSKHYALAIACGAKRGPKDSDLTFSPASLRDFLKALDQPEQKPVAEVKRMMTGANAGIATRIVEIDDPMRERLRPGQMLYTAPPQRKPLTDDEIEAIAKMIEDAPELVPLAKNDQGGCVICGFDPKFAAAFIRARGNT